MNPYQPTSWRRAASCGVGKSQPTGQGNTPIKNLGEQSDNKVINPHLSPLPLFSSDTVAVQDHHETFPTFGHKVLSCEVPTDERSYTFVHDDTAVAVEFSTGAVDATLLGNKSLR